MGIYPSLQAVLLLQADKDSFQQKPFKTKGYFYLVCVLSARIVEFCKNLRSARPIEFYKNRRVLHEPSSSAKPVEFCKNHQVLQEPSSSARPVEFCKICQVLQEPLSLVTTKTSVVGCAVT